MEEYDLSGKTIVPFCSHGGGRFGQSLTAIAKLAPDSEALLDRLPLTGLTFFDLSNIEKPIEQLEEPLSLREEDPGYDPIAGEMVIYRPWGNFTFFMVIFGIQTSWCRLVLLKVDWM